MGGVSVPCLYHSIFKGSRHRPWETDTEAKLQKISWRTSIQIKRGKISDLHEGELKQTIHWRCPVVVTNGQALVLLPCPITIGCCQKKKKKWWLSSKAAGKPENTASSRSGPSFLPAKWQMPSRKRSSAFHTCGSSLSPPASPSPAQDSQAASASSQSTYSCLGFFSDPL